MSYPFHTFHETPWASVYLQFLHNLAIVCLIFSQDCFPREKKYAMCRVFNAKCPFNRSWTSLNWSLGGICFITLICPFLFLLEFDYSPDLFPCLFPPGLSCCGWALECLNVSSCLEVTLTAPGKTWLCFLSKNWGDNQFLGNKHELICGCLLAHGDKARGSSLCVDNIPASLKPWDNLRESCACFNHPSVHPGQTLSCKTITAH